MTHKNAAFSKWIVDVHFARNALDDLRLPQGRVIDNQGFIITGTSKIISRRALTRLAPTVSPEENVEHYAQHPIGQLEYWASRFLTAACVAIDSEKPPSEALHEMVHISAAANKAIQDAKQYVESSTIPDGEIRIINSRLKTLERNISRLAKHAEAELHYCYREVPWADRVPRLRQGHVRG